MSATGNRRMIHPGEHLAAWMKSTKTSRRKAADALDISARELTRLLDGQTFDNDLVVPLQSLTGLPATFWGRAWQDYLADRKVYAESIRTIATVEELETCQRAQIAGIVAANGSVWTSTGKKGTAAVWKTPGSEWGYSSENLLRMAKRQFGSQVFGIIYMPEWIFAEDTTGA